MTPDSKPSPREAALYEAYDEILLKIALTRLQEREDARLVGEPMSDREKEDCERFFCDTQERTLHIIHRACHRRSARRAGWRALRRAGLVAGCALLAFFVTLSVAVAALPPFRANLLGFLARFDAGNSALLNQAPIGWRGKYYPTFYPDGFQLAYLHEDDTRVVYENPITSQWWSYSECDQGGAHRAGARDAERVDTEVNGVPAALFVEKEVVNLVWSVDDRRFEVTGILPVDTIEQIAKSYQAATK